MTEYEIIEESSITRMKWEVKQRLKYGWKPQGGVSVYKPYDSYDHRFIQVVVHENKN